MELFRKLGFTRKQCPKCLKFFWTIDQQKDVCGDSRCVGYSFIGERVTKDELTYGECWDKIEKFFKNNGHASISRYPVVCRWFPGLYFTIAGIVDFQRMTDSTTVFELPHNPCILAQPCLRFNDIPNVGITGRHYTNFAMVQQTSIHGGNEKGYWKDKCIDLDFELLTKVFGIRDKEITFLEDVWAGPNAFGPSLEFFAHGLELGNAVFTQFLGNADSRTEMGKKVIDMGAGLERFAWISRGTATSYDAVFSEAIDYMKKMAGIKDSEIFGKYAVLAGRLDIEDTPDVAKSKEDIAKAAGISAEEYKEIIEPMQAIYAIADHTKTLLLAIADGAMPSNVSGGYNLRVILRRALSFMDEFGFDFELERVAEKHSVQLKKLYPELEESLESFRNILGVEKGRYGRSVERARSMVRKELEKGIGTGKMIELYTSHGITPEIMEKEAKAMKSDFQMPADFYSRLTETHMKESSKENDAFDGKIVMLPKTGLLFYEFQNESVFDATVLDAFENAVVLDRTLFYPEGGGQIADTGAIDGAKVTDVQKRHGVVMHFVENRKFSAGQKVKGAVDFGRRRQIMQHHTAVHVINGACRQVIGKHIWQSGTRKTEEKAWLDVTHYLPFSDEEIADMERLANAVVRNDIEVKEHIMPRMDAERQFGLRIYQGGAIPSDTLRIIEIPSHDVEACGGTHVSSTGEIGKIIIISSERIADGVNRLTIKAGGRAEAFLGSCLKEAMEIESLLEGSGIVEVSDELSKELGNGMKAYRELQRGGRVFDVSHAKVKETIERFLKEIEHLRTSIEERKVKEVENEVLFKAESLEDACKHIFSTWKRLSKEKESAYLAAASRLAGELEKKISEGRILDIIAATREEMLKAAGMLAEKSSRLTVMLANQSGDFICMSTHEDAGSIAKDICSKAGGKGGGGRKLAFGKVEISKMIKVMKELDKN